MKKKIMNGMEAFSKAMVQPLMYLSVGGLVLAIGALITNNTIQEALPFLGWTPIQVLGKFMYQSVMMVINNLGVVFAIGIPAAFAKKDKHHAGIIGFMSYLMYLKTSNVLLEVTGQMAEPSEMIGLIGTGQAEILGIQCVDMSVFGGIILGCIVGYVFNRTSQKSFNGAAQIFSGVRFTFLVMIFASILFGSASNVIWPWAQKGISALAGVIKNSGTFGLFLYGFLERLLVPTGLHHLVYTPFQFSDLGGVLQVGDNTVVGAYAIAMTELNMPVEKMSDSIYYMAIGFTKMFGYIGIGAAFIHTAYKENKKRVRSTMIPLIVTACLASITEPIDFMFIFCAPVLFVVHAAIAGLFLALLKVFGVTSFCGGNILASFITNMAAGADKTNWPMMYVLAAVQIVLYFVVFSFLIKKLDLKTPGREAVAAEEQAQEGGAPPKGTALTANVASLVEGLGGKDNINSTENCFTRLRVNVKDPSLLKDDLINKVPNSGIVKKEDDIQIIIGLKVAEVRTAVEDYLKSL